jgi:hypothetical protein
LHRSAAAFAPPETIAACGQVIRRLPAPSLPARPTSRLKRPDPCQSKQGLLACPILSLPAWACAGTPLMIPAPHYPGPLPSSARSSLSSTVRSSSRAPAPRRPHRRPITSSNPHVVYSRGLCWPIRGALALPIAWTRCAQLTPPRARCRLASAPATASTPTPNLNVSLPQTPSQILNLSLPRLWQKSPSS